MQFSSSSTSHSRFKSLLVGSLIALSIVISASARTWTSADGSKTFKGTLKKYDAEKGHVTIVRSNGRTITFSENKLSADDIEFIKANPPKSAGSSSSTKAKSLPDTLPDPDGKEADMSKPVKVFILMGQSNMVGFGKSSGLKTLATGGKYPYLVDESGEWTTCKDVRNVRVMCSGSSPWKLLLNEWLSGSNAGSFGPEVGIGYHLGYALDQPVLILKSCIGNRSLGYDLLPPSAEGTGTGGKSYEGNKDDPTRTPKPGPWYAGVQYDGDTKAAKDVLKDLGKYYPGATKYEIGGFFFWQGAKDLGKQGRADTYEQNLVHLIKDLRTDFNAPNAPFVCATMGQEKKGGTITDAQLAVDGKKGKYPEFKGNVATFYTHPVSKGGSANGHYGSNPETYMNVGVGMGKAMVELLSN